MVLERPELGVRLRGIAHHAAIGGDERDAAPKEFPEPICLAIESRLVERNGRRKQVGDEVCLVTQMSLDRGALPLP